MTISPFQFGYRPLLSRVSSCLTVFVCKSECNQFYICLDFLVFRLNANAYSFRQHLTAFFSLVFSCYLWTILARSDMPTNDLLRTRTPLLCHWLSLKVKASRKESFRKKSVRSLFGQWVARYDTIRSDTYTLSVVRTNCSTNNYFTWYTILMPCHDMPRNTYKMYCCALICVFVGYFSFLKVRWKRFSSDN